MRKISFKEHKSVSHHKAVKKKHLGKILSHSEPTSPLGDGLQSTFFQTVLFVWKLLGNFPLPVFGVLTKDLTAIS